MTGRTGSADNAPHDTAPYGAAAREPYPRAKRVRPLVAAMLAVTVAGVVSLAARDAPRPEPPSGPDGGPGSGGVPVPARLGTLPPTPLPPGRWPAPPATTNPYALGIDRAVRHGLRVWIEVDLPTAWSAGEPRWSQTLRYVGELANRPGVVGIKIADELGYKDRLSGVDEGVRFLRAADRGLGRVAPGKRLLVDFYVSDAGCLPGSGSAWARACAAEFRRRHPRCTLDAVDRYLRTGVLDVVDYAPEIITADEYDGGTVDPAWAMRTAWQEARRRGWDRRVVLQGRLAPAFPGRYRHGRDDAEATLRTELDVPIAMGAQAVDVWTWQQHYAGERYHLIDPGLRPNALWVALRERRARGARLFTHVDPTIVDRGVDADLNVIKTVFSDIFVMPGLGW